MKTPRFVELLIMGKLSNIFRTAKDAMDYVKRYGVRNYEIREII